MTIKRTYIYVLIYSVAISMFLFSCVESISSKLNGSPSPEEEPGPVGTAQAFQTWQEQCTANSAEYSEEGTAIAKAAELKSIDESLGEAYYLSANIDLSNDQWQALGSESEPFTGELSGNCYIISGLSIDASKESYQGLFASIGQGASVNNLGISISKMTAASVVGGLAGYAKDAVLNNIVVGSSVGIDNEGSLIAANVDGNIQSKIIGVSSSVESIIEEEAGAYVGGILGIADESVELTGVNLGLKVEADTGSSAGGLVGYNKGKLRGSNSGVLASTSGKNIGGLVGHMAEGSLVGYYTGYLASDTAQNLGGLVGSATGGTVEGYFTGTVDVGMGGTAGGLVGYLKEAVLGGFSLGWVIVDTENARGSFGCAVGLSEVEAQQYSYCDSSLGVHVGMRSAFDKIRLTDDDIKSVMIDGASEATQEKMSELDGSFSDASWVFNDGEWPQLAFDNSLDAQEQKVSTTAAPQDMQQGRMLVSEYMSEWSQTCAQAAQNEGGFPKTTGTEVVSVQDLLAIENDYAGEYYLANDIDVSGSSWDPIGDEFRAFSGILHGNCFVISGLLIDAPDVSFQGLFARLSEDSSVKKLGIIVDGIRAHSITGALAGRAMGAVIDDLVVTSYDPDEKDVDIAASGSITDSVLGEIGAFAGGLVGILESDSNLKATTAGVNVKSTTGSMIGGLAGYVSSSQVLGIAEGDVSSDSGDSIGGLVGAGKSASIYGYASGIVSASSGSSVGGLIGTHDGGTVSGMSDSTVFVEAGNAAGGLVGAYINGNVSGYTLGWIVTSTDNTQKDFGCAIGSNPSDLVSKTYCDISMGDHVGKIDPIGENGIVNADMTSKGINGPNEATAEKMPDLSNIEGIQSWEFSVGEWPKMSLGGSRTLAIVIPAMPDSFRDNNLIPDILLAFRPQCLADKELDEVGITEGIAISNAAGLQSIKDDLSGTYHLAANIEITAESWNPIKGDSAEEFKGTLHGNCRVIAGLTIDDTTSTYAGLFAKLGEGALIENLAIGVSKLKGKAVVGALAGYASQSTVSNVVVAPMVAAGSAQVVSNGSLSLSFIPSNSVGSSSGSFAGGLVGLFLDGMVKDTHNYSLNIYGSSRYVGGLIGFNTATVQNASASGSVSQASGEATGGLLGFTSADVQGSASGNVDGANYVGGLIGYVDYNPDTTNIVGSASGNVRAEANFGGLVGEFSGDTLYGTATGDLTKISGASGYIGGLVGSSYTGTIIGTATGDIHTNTSYYVGGLIGFLSDTVVIGNASGNVHVDDGNKVGGLLGMGKSGSITGYSLGFVSTLPSGSGADFGSVLGKPSLVTVDTYQDISTDHTGRIDQNKASILGNADSKSLEIDGPANANATNMGKLTEGTTAGTWKFESGKWPVLLLPEGLEPIELQIPTPPENFSP